MWYENEARISNQSHLVIENNSSRSKVYKCQVENTAGVRTATLSVAEDGKLYCIHQFCQFCRKQISFGRVYIYCLANQTTDTTLFSYVLVILRWDGLGGIKPLAPRFLTALFAFLLMYTPFFKKHLLFRRMRILLLFVTAGNIL